MRGTRAVRSNRNRCNIVPSGGNPPSAVEIDRARTPKGAWSKAQLAEWGVPWPPPGGWKRHLESEAERLFAEREPRRRRRLTRGSG